MKIYATLFLTIFIKQSLQMSESSSYNNNYNNNNNNKDYEFINRNSILIQLDEFKLNNLYLVIPALICGLLIMFLAKLMFGTRIGIKKRIQQTPARELVQYYNVKSTCRTLQLRYSH
jgi:hypothetical protein